MKDKNTMKKTTIKKLKKMIKTDLKKWSKTKDAKSPTNYFYQLEQLR
jgi:hypothetical protein